MLGDKRVGIAQGVFVNDSKKESQNLLLGVAGNNAYVVRLKSESGFVCGTSGRQDSERRRAFRFVARREGEIFYVVNRKHSSGVGNDFGGGISEIRGPKSKNPPAVVSSVDAHPRSRGGNSGLSVQQCGSGGLFGKSDIFTHPFFLSQYRYGLQHSDSHKKASEYYEQAVIYFLYSLCPIFFVMGLGGYLALFSVRFGVDVSNVGSSLIYGGFIYVFCGVLFIGSGLLWWQ
jgi:hypothetical protein